jgi:hypothetical protein
MIRHAQYFLPLRRDLGEAASHADNAVGIPLLELVGVDNILLVVTISKVQD